MTTDHQGDRIHTEVKRRKPRIALMGEFSAGKSTLTNLLIGSRAIPMKVTATQLPPVWISLGKKPPYHEDLEGNRKPLDLSTIEDVPVDETRFVRLFKPTSEILEICDIIDLPGISDPNMASDVWYRALEHVDGVIWLTHATQAWRQSEAAVWDSIVDEFGDKSLLLLTRFDKIIGERDRMRVLKRVEMETDGLFRKVLPISLIEAMAAREDPERWASSGAEAFNDAFLELLSDLGGVIPQSAEEDSPMAAAPKNPERPARKKPKEFSASVSPKRQREPEAAGGSVVPRRVSGGVRPVRPVRPRPPR